MRQRIRQQIGWVIAPLFVAALVGGLALVSNGGRAEAQSSNPRPGGRG